MRVLSLSFIMSVIFLGYIANTIWTIAEMFIPPVCRKGDKCLKSYLVNSPKQKLIFFSSVFHSPTLAVEVEELREMDNFNYDEPFSIEINLNVPRKTRRNGTLYLYISMVDSAKDQLEWKNIYYNEPIESVPLTVYAVPQAATFNLINSKGEDMDEKHKRNGDNKPVTHLKSHVTFSILTDHITFPVDKIPNEIYPLLRISKGQKYKPIIQYNLLKTRVKDFIEISPKSHNVTLTVDYSPISYGKLRLLQHLKITLRTLQQIGFSEKDIDDVKGIFADTNLYLLCATTFIASIHILFDFLAFKNDVSFWRQKRSMAGLSMRTVVWRAFSQGVILLYLFDEKTSLIVIVPASIATLIEIWKVNKVLKYDIQWTRCIPKIILRKDLYSEAEKRTQAVDAEAMKYLSYLLYPLCIGGAIYSLVYEPHKSWYSWSLHSLVNGVYAFGFLFMLPQLFVNYKLKSVAALPWRAFMYKAFNTFIDDVFAFIITMPTAHRVACFRDDIVFIIYLYQRWLYPVDKSRTDETLSMDEPQQAIIEKKQQ